MRFDGMGMSAASAPERREVDLLVVGGTPAAATAAETALALGARPLHVREPSDLRFTGRRGRLVEATLSRTDARGLRVHQRLAAHGVVLACGTEPAIPPVAGLPDVRTFTSVSLAETGVTPESLLVLGGGPTGCAEAAYYASRGARVTVVEAADRLLPGEEPFASAAVTRTLTDAGVRVLVGGTVTKVSPTLDGGVYAGTEVGGDVAAGHLLVATGRRGATGGLELPGLGLAVERGLVAVDSSLAGSVPGIFAAGEVTGLVEGEHADPVMGRVAAVNALLARRRPRLRGARRPAMPGPLHWRVDATLVITRTDPPIARVGLTRQEALDRGDLVDVRIHEVTDGGPPDDPGPAELVAPSAGPRIARIVTARPLGGGRRDSSHPEPRVVVGATLVGPDAYEDIALLVLAVHTRTPVDALATVALPPATVGHRMVELLSRPGRAEELSSAQGVLETASRLL